MHVYPPLMLSCSSILGLVKLLKAFVHARRSTGSSPDRGWKSPNKSKAKAVDRATLVELAFECRTWQLKLKELTVEEVAVHEQVVAAPNPTMETLGNTNNSERPSSFFLQDRNCVGGSIVEFESVDEAMKARADLLAFDRDLRIINPKKSTQTSNPTLHWDGFRTMVLVSQQLRC
jgi:hypothetical protein